MATAMRNEITAVDAYLMNLVLHSVRDAPAAQRKRMASRLRDDLTGKSGAGSSLSKPLRQKLLRALKRAEEGVDVEAVAL